MHKFIFIDGRFTREHYLGCYSALLLLIFKSAFLDVVDPICRARHRRHCLTRLDSLSESIHYFVGTIDAQKLPFASF
jgi:hypothetical protein